MNFDLTDDQAQIQETVRRLMNDRYTTPSRNAYRAGADGWSRDLWQAYADLGLTALSVPTDCGGLGGTADDQYVVMRELGRAAILEPYLGTCIAAATAIALGGDAQQRQHYLPQIASGTLIVGWADGTAGGRQPSSVRARAWGDGWRLAGTCSLVLHAASAACLLVSALDGEGRTSLFLVHTDGAGVELRSYRLVDGTPAGDVQLADAAAVLLGTPEQPAGQDVIAGSTRACIAALSAEAVGAMGAALDLTISYLNTRTQFGKPLATNQALRHRCADMAVLLECSESMAMLAAIAVSDPDGCESTDLQAARTVVTHYGRLLCEHAIQLHGGIGMTEEYGVGRYLQRMMVIEQLFVENGAPLTPAGS